MMTYEENMEAKEKMYEQIDNADTFIKADTLAAIFSRIPPFLGIILFVPISIMLIIRLLFKEDKMVKAETERKRLEDEKERENRKMWDDILEKTNENKRKLREAIMAEQEMTKEDWKRSWN